MQENEAISKPRTDWRDHNGPERSDWPVVPGIFIIPHETPRHRIRPANQLHTIGVVDHRQLNAARSPARRRHIKSLSSNQFEFELPGIPWRYCDGPSYRGCPRGS
jgi:hypothetical protein